jgi:tetrachloro-p-hydroquinone reductive dehalogenase
MPNTQPAVVLYHQWPSLCSQKVRLALAEKQVAYTSVVVDIGPRMQNYEPWYARINPNMVVPTLVVHEPGASEPTIVTDSARIIVWIDEKLEGPALLPAEPELRHRVEQWIRQADRFPVRELMYGTMGGPLGYIARSSMQKRIARLERHRERNPDLTTVYERRLADVRSWKQTIADPEQIAALERQLSELLAEFEVQLEQEGEFVVGDRYTLADVIWTVFIARMVLVGRTEQLGPLTRAWYARMRERPSFMSAQLWERKHVGVLLRMMAPFLLPRLLVILALLAAVIWLSWWLIG